MGRAIPRYVELYFLPVDDSTLIGLRLMGAFARRRSALALHRFLRTRERKALRIVTFALRHTRSLLLLNVTNKLFVKRRELL